MRISIDHISHIEAMSEYLRITCDNRPKPVIVLLSMKKIEEHLPSTMFMRIHRSFIINLNKISEIKKNHVVLDGEVSLPIGDNYKDFFKGNKPEDIVAKYGTPVYVYNEDILRDRMRRVSKIITK